MGLPDFYVTTEGATHRTLGSWDIMDYGPYNNGGNTPPNYSAYERWFMGWFEPTLIHKACRIELPALQDTKAACLITANGTSISNILKPSPSTFYLIENRQQAGWDKYLAGSGMMVTKIQWNENKWITNTVNNTSTSMGVDIIEAKKNTSRYYDWNTDLYPKGATEFTDVANFQVTNIQMSNSIIVFDVNGGGDPIRLDVESVQTSDDGYHKILKDGKLYIMHKGTMYDAMGRGVSR